MEGHRVPMLILTHWYECGRKIRHSTEVTASMFLVEQQRAHLEAWGPKDSAMIRRPYLCERCGWWHLGRPKSTKPEGWRIRQLARRNRVKAWNEQAYTE